MNEGALKSPFDKLLDRRALPLRLTSHGRWMVCPMNEATTVVQIHSYLRTSLDYTVLRLTFNKETGEQTFIKLASFSRRQWAESYIRHGMVACTLPCVHGRECRQQRPAYNNSAPSLVYCYFIIGRGKLRVHSKLFSYKNRDTVQQQK